MALNIANISELRDYQSKLENNKTKYQETIDKLVDIIRLTSIYWQGAEGNEYRNKLYTLVKTNLNCAFEEMTAEINYLNRLVMVLENTQEQIKSRLRD